MRQEDCTLEGVHTNTPSLENNQQFQAQNYNIMFNAEFQILVAYGTPGIYLNLFAAVVVFKY